MGELNPNVDNYIDKAEDFAKPILIHWRKLIHKACPEVAEAIKWSYPHFDYKGDFMCVIAAYKSHCSFSFIKSDLMKDPRLQQNSKLKASQRFLGKVTKVPGLPDDKELIGLIKDAMSLNEKGIKAPARKSDKPKVIEMPDFFAAELAKNPKAKAVFDKKSDSFRKEYLVWIIDAKSQATRDKRVEEALSWIAEGKSRFWKYAK